MDENINKLKQRIVKLENQIRKIEMKYKIETSRSDDYAWLEFDNYEFYYGYEDLDDSCDEDDNSYDIWNFYAIKDKNRKNPVMKLSEREFAVYNDNIDDVQQGLLTGIAIWIRKTYNSNK